MYVFRDEGKVFKEMAKYITSAGVPTLLFHFLVWYQDDFDDDKKRELFRIEQKRVVYFMLMEMLFNENYSRQVSEVLRNILKYPSCPARSLFHQKQVIHDFIPKLVKNANVSVFLK